MEGKAVLFKKFAGIDVFDLEIEQSDPHKLIDMIAALEPTFGAINLEDIKAPECFLVERELRKRMKIPVFHDDQHGTAITVGAAVLNGLKVCGKQIGQIKLVVSGAGAAALACVELLLDLGLVKGNIWLSDLAGVVYEGRKELMDPDQGAVRAANPRAHARRHHRRSGRVPGPVGRRCPHPGHGLVDGAEAFDSGPGQSDSGDPAGGSQGGAGRCGDCHGAQRLSEPSEQRAVLSLHFSRRIGCRRHHHHPADGNRRGACACRARAPGAKRYRGGGLWRHRGLELRSRILDSQAVRSAPDREDRAGGCPGGDGIGRRRRARSRSGGLQPAPAAIRLSQRHADAADLCGSAQDRCRERSRIVYAEGEDERVLRAVQIAVDEKLSRRRSWWAGRR